ncbi:hypothetical protein RB8357 [Rhodopirellula baltica SH 1]|uniref:Uncharacterized protein n=1 Tax=Rhodopirellula baltica (strain DSM 10527 / NCIMB 13988 / SH1) TaxID=243090 RepID=Q7UFT2_RHOBA|nr:hypothetical protein RB8357 [Rhodopirellula baltica SH 1]
MDVDRAAVATAGTGHQDFLLPLTSNGFVFTVLRTTPLRMHCVQTRIDLLVPFGNVT